MFKICNNDIIHRRGGNVFSMGLRGVRDGSADIRGDWSVPRVHWWTTEEHTGVSDGKPQHVGTARGTVGAGQFLLSVNIAW